jgi:uncharacterized protein (TIGR02001 family)
MKKSLIAALLAGLFAVPALAQTPAPEAAPAAEPASPHTLTANVGLFSSYRFRGIDQTFGNPAIQGGFDYAHESGFYLGNWNSNVSEYAGFPEGNLEMDFYGGYKLPLGDFTLDFGGIYYYYPGSKIGGTGSAVDNFELYVGASWKFLSFKYSHALTDYFDIADTKNTGYFDLAANYDLGDGWGINGHVGYTSVNGSSDLDYTDWKIGVTKAIDNWTIGLAYVDTNADENFYTWVKPSGKDIYAGKATAVLSVSRTF